MLLNWNKSASEIHLNDFTCYPICIQYVLQYRIPVSQYGFARRYSPLAMGLVTLKSDPNCFTVLFGSDNIQLRISDCPLNDPMESLLPKFGGVANGAKHNLMFDQGWSGNTGGGNSHWYLSVIPILGNTQNGKHWEI